ncbi:hypothetical protein GCM10023259_021800 [Thermocatellispora tengchongensis]
MMVPKTWLGRMQAQMAHATERMAHATERVGPMASDARDMAAERIVNARSWAAPRLDRAAHTVEEQLAPRVSAMLADAARRIDPKPVRSRRWPMLVLLSGLALGAAGFYMYRKNAQQWTDTMRDSAADASQWMGEKAEQTGERISEKAETAGTAADRQAEEISKKMS